MLNRTTTVEADRPIRVVEAARLAARMATEIGLTPPSYQVVWQKSFGLTEGTGRAIYIAHEDLPELWRRLGLTP